MVEASSKNNQDSVLLNMCICNTNSDIIKSYEQYLREEDDTSLCLGTVLAARITGCLLEDNK